jgi:hypothetical protein
VNVVVAVVWRRAAAACELGVLSGYTGMACLQTVHTRVEGDDVTGDDITYLFSTVVSRADVLSPRKAVTFSSTHLSWG